MTVSILYQVGMRCNSFIVLDGAGREVGERSYARIVTDFTVMQNNIGPNGAVGADNGIA